MDQGAFLYGQDIRVIRAVRAAVQLWTGPLHSVQHGGSSALGRSDNTNTRHPFSKDFRGTKNKTQDADCTAVKQIWIAICGTTKTQHRDSKKVLASLHADQF